MAPPRGEVALVFERMEGPTLDLFILSGGRPAGVCRGHKRMSLSPRPKLRIGSRSNPLWALQAAPTHRHPWAG